MKYREIAAILFLFGILTGCSLSTAGGEYLIIVTATPRPVTVTPVAVLTTTPIIASTVPTPTLDLSTCTVHGCDAQSPDTMVNVEAIPTGQLVWLQEFPRQTTCDDCPENPLLSPAELASITEVDPATLSLLQTLVTSSQAYEISPGIVYIVDHNTHHIVIDLEEPGYRFRNVISDGNRDRLITPSFCMSRSSLVITNADYHGLNGSNKTEAGREVFFHPGWSALFKLDNRFDIDVLDEESYERTEISWGGGPIFIWDGVYHFNPKYEWFTPESLTWYETSQRSVPSAALSTDRKYLMLTVSTGLTLEQHAEQLIHFGERWGIEIEKAIRFDGDSSAYLAMRLGEKVVPVLRSTEPTIANCLAVEKED
ncbi:MAG: hypothetical protein JXB30_10875 [Anaerolineae bacterium]|nr:hypothetical protein [Anaerolineae bacterium]